MTNAIPTFELAVLCEIFGLDRSDIVDPWYELRLCAAEAGPLRTVAGMQIHTTHNLDDLFEADTVVVLGCSRAVHSSPPPSLVEAVCKAYELGRRIVSLCTGAYVLAAAGLLTGRSATTHWMNASDFARRFPKVHFDPAVLYTDDGNILTSAGAGAAIDLCFHLLRRDHGAAVANEVARRMVVPPHREGGQAQYTPLLVPPENSDDLAPVLQWARDRLDQPLTISQFARTANLSERTLARRFHDQLGTTPLQWLQRQRVRLAQELLETSDQSIESIARRVGFRTAANLRHHFGSVTGMSPMTYRRVFRYRWRSQHTAEPISGS
ncbi:GlxA family transcriptional regulator [Nonomuraea recticatena]|uniref:GlxA family transcriptional regulator n=1 Tax=Nonomuraea recticatena TaxID=46178 RepID=UPI003611E347